MKRALMLSLLVLAAACRSAGGPEPGQNTSEMAVNQFVSAARAQDMQALSTVWGNADSPTRDRVEREELERRMLIIMCHLKHDESRIGAARPGEAGRTLHTVDFKKGELERSSTFTTVRNAKSNRWYVEDVDLSPLRDLCAQTPKGSAKP